MMRICLAGAIASDSFVSAYLTLLHVLLRITAGLSFDIIAMNYCCNITEMLNSFASYVFVYCGARKIILKKALHIE